MNKLIDKLKKMKKSTEIQENNEKMYAYPQPTPKGQAKFNAAGFLGGLVNAAVDNLTGNDLLGDIAGGITSGLLNR